MHVTRLYGVGRHATAFLKVNTSKMCPLRMQTPRVSPLNIQTARFLCTAAPAKKQTPDDDELGSTKCTSGPNLGSSSPWSQDVWDRIGGEVSSNAAFTREPLLEPKSLAIPLNDADRQNMPTEKDILDSYERRLQARSQQHLGYPYNLSYQHRELHRFLDYTINNLGDPFVSSNYGVHSREFEVAVIDFFAKLWKFDSDDYWGYVTTCGTEGNLHGMLLARECHPDAMLYSSTETHYSIFKAARYYKMDYTPVNTLPMGEIDYEALERELIANSYRDAIINVNVGTTVKGAVDNLDRILRVLHRTGYTRDRYHIHCDGALFAMMLPFVEYGPEISFQKPIDSMTVSGHKMLGCPMPCGVALTRKEHVKKVEQRIDYLNSVDTTIMGSRNGQAALFMWHSLRVKGSLGIQEEVRQCLDTAGYLRDRLTTIGVTSRLNDLSSTVVLERPVSSDFIQRWQLACEKDIAHVVVMPNITRKKIDIFIEDLQRSVKKNGRFKVMHPDSPLAKLSDPAWGGVTPPPLDA